MQNPLVSIIIPTYARPTNLVRAIESVLSQTYSPIEIFVVDDNGVGTPFQKETEELLSPYISEKKITYMKHEVNKNGSAARNTGSRASHGEIIGYLDDDDVFMPDKVEEQLKCLQEAHARNPKMMGVYCNIEMIGFRKQGEYVLKNKGEGNLTEALLLGKVRFNSSTIMLYRTAFDEMGGWDERFARHQDWEFFVRFFRNYEMALACPDRCLIKKNHTPNVNSRHPERMARNMDFFLTEMKPDIMRLPHGRDIMARLYLATSRMSFRQKCRKEGYSCLKKAKTYKSIGLKDYTAVLRSIAKGYLSD